MWISFNPKNGFKKNNQQEEYFICYLKKIPEGFTQNRYGEKFEIGKQYFYQVWNNNFYIYENIHNQSIMYRDSTWFYEHFQSKESFRDELIKKILEP